MIPTDIYDDYPYDMLRYLRNYGWTFNRKACEWATSRMRSRTAFVPTTKAQVDDLLNKYGVALENNHGYDYVYVANMAKADFMGSSIADEKHLAMYVKDVIDDVDAPDGVVFRKWVASMTAAGEPIEWSDLL